MNRFKLAMLISLLVLATIAGVFIALRTYSERDQSFVMGNTSCMSPTISSGELIWVKPFDPKRDQLRRYQIVVFWSPVPFAPSEKWVMRVVGLPGEQLEISTNSLLVNGSTLEMNDAPFALREKQWLTAQTAQSSGQRKWVLRSDEVFVVGDNLSTANDSRLWGPLRISNVIALVERTAGGKELEVPLDPLLPVRAKIIVPDGDSRAVDSRK